MNTPATDFLDDETMGFLKEAQAQAMAAARKLSTMIAVTDNPQDAMALNKELTRAHRSLRQSALTVARLKLMAAAPAKPAPAPLRPDIRDREITLRRRRMIDALSARLEREVEDEAEREELEQEAEAWLDTQAVDEAFVTDPGPAQMARLFTHLGLPAYPAEDPPGVIRLRPG